MRRLRFACLSALAVVSTGCELTEVTSAPAEDVLVVEALLQRRDNIGFEPSSLTAFLHRTIEGEQGLSRPVSGAFVRWILEDGTELVAEEVAAGRCVAARPILGEGTCYEVSPARARRVRPGEQVRLEIQTLEGEVAEAVSVLPADFQLLVEGGGRCFLPFNTTAEINWTPSIGAWAYVNETEIRGLAGWGAQQNVEVSDPLDLLGLSVSAADTTIVFPAEFGIFDRADLEQELTVQLQQGLPEGTFGATVSITAVDRNYVNWVRGGSFNPSGQVRIPSVRGDATGFFGTGLVRSFEVRIGDENTCGPPPAGG